MNSSEGIYILSDKCEDGKIRMVKLTIDPYISKENLDIYDSVSCTDMLKYNDNWNSYYWNHCAGSYFCDGEVL